MSVKVTFDQEVKVVGRTIEGRKADENIDLSVVLTMNKGTSEISRAAALTGGSSSDSLEFEYEVQRSHLDNNGVTVSAFQGSSTIIAGGPEVQWDGRFPSLDNADAHKVDGRPYVTAVAITAGPSDGATYGAGENIEVTMTFSQVVDAENNPGIRLLLAPNDGSQWVASLRVARYKSGSGTDSIVFSYEVQDSDSDADGVTLDIDLVETGWGLHDFRGGDIYASGTTIPVRSRFPATMYSVTSYNVGSSPDATPTPTPAPTAEPSADETAPTVSSVAFTSDPGDDGAYGIGDRIEVTATFSEDVAVTGTPQLTLDIGGSEENASYESVTGAVALFAYTVEEGDADADGIAIGADARSLNGGSIADAEDNAAVLTHVAVDDDDGHTVDGVRPTFTSAAVSEDGTQVVVTFSESPHAALPPAVAQRHAESAPGPVLQGCGRRDDRRRGG